MTKVEKAIVQAYLFHSRSHRWIQENIMGISAPTRGGGFEAMKVLHKYNLFEKHKGLLDENIPTNL